MKKWDTIFVEPRRNRKMEEGWSRLISLLESRCVFHPPSDNFPGVEKEIKEIRRILSQSPEREKGLSDLVNFLWKSWEQFVMDKAASFVLNQFPDYKQTKESLSSSDFANWVRSRLIQTINGLHTCLFSVLPLFLSLHRALRSLESEEEEGDYEDEDGEVESQFRDIIQAMLFGAMPHFSNILFHFFLKQFQDYVTSHPFSVSPPGSPSSSSFPSLLPSPLKGEEISEEFRDICDKLRQLGLISVSESVFTEVLFSQIVLHVAKVCPEQYDSPVLETCQQWLYQVVLPWLEVVLEQKDSSEKEEGLSEEISGNEGTRTYRQWKRRLEFFFYETFADLRISELFDIIGLFPDSSAAVMDLRTCLFKTDLYSHFISSLKQSFSRRLLRPDVASSVIISHYFSTIKAMHLLDASGVILEQVSRPIRQYLAQRDDTIRCVVQLLTDPENELHDELQNNETVNEGEDGDVYIGKGSTGDIVAEMERLTKWQPAPPPDLAPVEGAVARQVDIIRLLVSIYGSKEMFVNEYKSMLGEKLLSATDYNATQEARTLELLKLRFGEMAYTDCSVMLKDMADSKRIDAHIWSKIREKKISFRQTDESGVEEKSDASLSSEMNVTGALSEGWRGIEGESGMSLSGMSGMSSILSQGSQSSESGLGEKGDEKGKDEEEEQGDDKGKSEEGAEEDVYHATIVSRVCWPQIDTEVKVKPPPEVEKWMECYTKEYSRHKPARTLQWAMGSGAVQLELDMANGSTKSVKATPLQASLISHFDDLEEPLSIEELSERIEAPEELVRKCAMFWVGNGVLVETEKDHFVAAEQVEDGDEQFGFEEEEEEEEEDQWGLYETFILGMLKTHQSRPLDKIHSMLKMLVDGYGHSLNELAAFMNKLVSEEKVDTTDGVVFSIHR